jgi:hypothetical protein
MDAQEPERQIHAGYNMQLDVIYTSLCYMERENARILE